MNGRKGLLCPPAYPIRSPKNLVIDFIKQAYDYYYPKK